MKKRPLQEAGGGEGDRYTKRAATKEAAVTGRGRRLRRPLQEVQLVGRYNVKGAGHPSTVVCRSWFYWQ
jgi:hypothetical protein